jgi:hypothetical protein
VLRPAPDPPRAGPNESTTVGPIRVDTANKGAPGVDGQSIEDFEKDLKGNLYKVWLCRAADYAGWAILGANPSSSGVQVPASDSA